MSKQYENRIAREIHDHTGSEIRTYRCGYSGNNAMPQPDMLVTMPATNLAIELKGPIQSDTIYIDGEDLEQLIACTNADTVAALVVKFQRRSPVTIRWYGSVVGREDWDDMEMLEKWEALVPEEFDAKVTDGGNLRLRKPDTDQWDSAKASEDDYVVICGDLGVPIDESTVIELS